MGAYMKQVYPTFIVNIEDNPVHPFLVCVPDLDILTEGDSLFNAIEMARDAIGVAGITLEDRNTEIPTPSEQGTALEKVMKYSDEVDFSKGILTYVENVDILKEKFEIFLKSIAIFNSFSYTKCNRVARSLFDIGDQAESCAQLFYVKE
jgi:predicted RNase H-like HicB family nuclease